MENSQEQKSSSNGTSMHPTSSFYLTLSESEIRDAPYSEPVHLSLTTAVLEYCKIKILRPYLRLLSVTGLRSLWVEETESCYSWWNTLSFLYSIQVVVLLIIGHVLQYMACFRRDRGFSYKLVTSNNGVLFSNYQEREIFQEEMQIHEQICHGSTVFSYIIPSVLHLCGYLYAVFIFRSTENDQLSSLMERVFLSCSHITDGFSSQKRLVRLLWIFVALGIFWMVLSVLTVLFMMFEGNISFHWLDSRPNGLIITVKVILIIGTLWHDVIQATVISSYCLQAQLLTSYIYFLRAELLQYPIHSVNWMREICEFKKLLQYLNTDLASPVSFFIFINICWVISGTLWLFGYDQMDKETFPIPGISMLNIGLWLALTLAPFLQAARLTGACKELQSVGHEVRTRPFAHQSTPGSELDSILLFTSTLKMRATLYKIPITGSKLAVGFTFCAITTLVIGQCHYF